MYEFVDVEVVRVIDSGTVHHLNVTSPHATAVTVCLRSAHLHRHWSRPFRCTHTCFHDLKKKISSVAREKKQTISRSYCRKSRLMDYILCVRIRSRISNFWKLYARTSAATMPLRFEIKIRKETSLRVQLTVIRCNCLITDIVHAICK